MLFLMRGSDSTAPHLFVARSGKGHLEVVEPGRPDGVEPVDHLLETTASTQRQSHSCPAGRHAVTLHLFTVCAVGFWERAKWLFFWQYLRLHTGMCGPDAAVLSISPSDSDAERTQWTRSGSSTNRPAEGALAAGVRVWGVLFCSLNGN